MIEGERQPARSHSTAHVRVADRLVANHWVARLATLGFAAKGLLYLVAGGTVALAAVHVGGRARGTRGALTLLVVLPLGRLLVTFVALGICGFILRRVVQVLVPPTEGRLPKLIITRVLRRCGYAVSGLAHVGIALTALGLVLGLTSAPPQRDWITPLLERQPLNGWVSVFAGLAVIGVASFYGYMAVSRRFTIDLHMHQMRLGMRRIVLVFGVVGYAGRSVAFLLVGTFLLYAGWFVEKVAARGLGDILRALEVQPWGSWVLLVVAVGLIAYGLYLLLAARYLRLVATW